MFRRFPSVLAVLLLASRTAAWSQTLSIGTDSGLQGETVYVPVRLTAGVDCTAALLRVDYDPNVLGNPSAVPGPLATGTHSVDSYSPEPGRLDVSVFGLSGLPSFMTRSGTVVALTFTIALDAPLGETPINITTVGTPGLPATDLVDVWGASVEHAAENGSVVVLQGPSSVESFWMLYE